MDFRRRGHQQQRSPPIPAGNGQYNGRVSSAPEAMMKEAEVQYDAT
jgi:hypothetical protein